MSRGLSSQNLHTFLADVKANSHLFLGITDATMSHGEGWHFARLGRLLERADKTSRILDVKYFMLLPTVAEVGTPFDIIQWSALLKSASALEMYCKRYGRISPDDVGEFLDSRLRTFREPSGTASSRARIRCTPFPGPSMGPTRTKPKKNWAVCAHNWTSAILRNVSLMACTNSWINSKGN